MHVPVNVLLHIPVQNYCELLLVQYTNALGDSVVHKVLVNYLREAAHDAQRYDVLLGHVGNIAHGHLLAMEQGKVGESYIIAGPKYSLVEAFSLAEQISSVRAPHLHPVLWMMKATAAMIAFIGAVFPLS